MSEQVRDVRVIEIDCCGNCPYLKHLKQRRRNYVGVLICEHESGWHQVDWQKTDEVHSMCPLPTQSQKGTEL